MDSRSAADRTIDAEGAPVHPSFIECHMHASFQSFRGALPGQLAESAAFNSFESVFFNTVTGEEEHLAMALAAMEMTRGGRAPLSRALRLGWRGLAQARRFHPVTPACLARAIQAECRLPAIGAAPP